MAHHINLIKTILKEPASPIKIQGGRCKQTNNLLLYFLLDTFNIFISNFNMILLLEDNFIIYCNLNLRINITLWPHLNHDNHNRINDTTCAYR